MKFGRNQPRSQPIVRVARLEAIPYPATCPMQRPLSPTYGAPSTSQEGEDDNERDVSAHIPVEACEGGMPDVLLSAIAPN